MLDELSVEIGARNRGRVGWLDVRDGDRPPLPSRIVIDLDTIDAQLLALGKDCAAVTR